MWEDSGCAFQQCILNIIDAIKHLTLKVLTVILRESKYIKKP